MVYVKDEGQKRAFRVNFKGEGVITVALTAKYLPIVVLNYNHI